MRLLRDRLQQWQSFPEGEDQQPLIPRNAYVASGDWTDLLGIPEKEGDAHGSYRFCMWLKDWEKWKRCEGEKRCIEVTDNDDFVAVLEKFPRVDGEILVISRRHVDPYSDVSDIEKFTDTERINLCKILGETIGLMKNRLNAEKVYLYSFCEHWESEEIGYESKLTTEHLHFHLLPRYRGIRHKHLAAEKIFNIPDREISDSMLGALKNELLGKKQS